jgi:hypothetical protein
MENDMQNKMIVGGLNEENRNGNTGGEGSVTVNIANGGNWSKYS